MPFCFHNENSANQNRIFFLNWEESAIINIHNSSLGRRQKYPKFELNKRRSLVCPSPEQKIRKKKVATVFFGLRGMFSLKDLKNSITELRSEDRDVIIGRENTLCKIFFKNGENQNMNLAKD